MVTKRRGAHARNVFESRVVAPNPKDLPTSYKSAGASTQLTPELSKQKYSSSRINEDYTAGNEVLMEPAKIHTIGHGCLYRRRIGREAG